MDTNRLVRRYVESWLEVNWAVGNPQLHARAMAHRAMLETLLLEHANVIVSSVSELEFLRRIPGWQGRGIYVCCPFVPEQAAVIQMAAESNIPVVEVLTYTPILQPVHDILPPGGRGVPGRGPGRGQGRGRGRGVELQEDEDMGEIVDK